MKSNTQQESALGTEQLRLAVEKRFGVDIAIEQCPKNAEALAGILERSVCRNYSPQALPEDLVQILCATALSSPSKSDLQQADIIRVRDPKRRTAINALMPGSPWIAEAPEFFVICGDSRRLQQIFSERGREFPNNHLDCFFNASVDAGILLSTFVQAVHMVGLGACPISEIRDHVSIVSEILELPQWVFPVVGLVVGYPSSFEPFTPRLGLRATLHTDRYDSTHMDEDLAEYDERRIRERPYRRQTNPEFFGEVTQYGWTEEKFRQYSEVQRADFGTYIRSRGFKLD